MHAILQKINLRIDYGINKFLAYNLADFAGINLPLTVLPNNCCV